MAELSKKQKKNLYLGIGILFVIFIVVMLVQDNSETISVFDEDLQSVVEITVSHLNFIQRLFSPVEEAFFSTNNANLGDTVKVKESFSGSDVPCGEVKSAAINIERDFGGNLVKAFQIGNLIQCGSSHTVSVSFTPSTEGTYFAYTAIAYNNLPFKIFPATTSCPQSDEWTQWELLDGGNYDLDIFNDIFVAEAAGVENGDLFGRIFQTQDASNNCAWVEIDKQLRTDCDDGYIASGSNSQSTLGWTSCVLDTVDPIEITYYTLQGESCLPQTTTGSIPKYKFFFCFLESSAIFIYNFSVFINIINI